jgi:hypothetical protein
MKQYFFAAAAAVLALAALPALAYEANFERTLSVNGRVDLTVSTGSGSIHLTRGTGNQVHIIGHVRSNRGSDNGEARVREIAAHPPIEQTGNIIRIGKHDMKLNHVSIDYEIQAPADVYLEASSGSGNLDIDGVGHNAKLSTGSGDIHATGLQNGFTANTGSGNINIEGTGQGDVRAQTGSGGIDLRGIHGGLRAGTGSGDIKIAGTPTTEWKLETGSGGIEFTPGSSGFTLDASTGSGSIHSDPQMSVQGSLSRHHVTGKVNGGGPTVRMETGSGDIRIR